MRQIHLNENLSNQTLIGEAQQSYFGNCNLENTKFIGDWRGTDYVNNTGGADWTQADTYLSYWRGNDLIGAKFPTNIGSFHHEPPMEMFRVASEKETNAIHKNIMQKVYLYLKNLYAQGKHKEACLCRVYNKAMETSNLKLIMEIFYKVVKGYESWEWYLDRFVQKGYPTEPSVRPAVTDFASTLKGGFMQILDSNNLPALPRPNDRYELARYFEKEAIRL